MYAASLPPPHELQLLQAVGFLNKHGFAHLDIKRENIVLEPINEATDEHTFEQLFAPLQCTNQAAGSSHAAVDIRVSFSFLGLFPLPQQRTGTPHRFRPCGTHPAHAALMSQYPKISGNQQLGGALPQRLQCPRSKYVLDTSSSIISRLMHNNALPCRPFYLIIHVTSESRFLVSNASELQPESKALSLAWRLTSSASVAVSTCSPAACILSTRGTVHKIQRTQNGSSSYGRKFKSRSFCCFTSSFPTFSALPFTEKQKVIETCFRIKTIDKDTLQQARFRNNYTAGFSRLSNEFQELILMILQPVPDFRLPPGDSHCDAPIARLFERFPQLFGPVSDEQKSSIVQNITPSTTQSLLLQVNPVCVGAAVV